MSMSTIYKLHKSDKIKGEEGKYQILETVHNKNEVNTSCCGVYFSKRDALIDLVNMNSK